MGISVYGDSPYSCNPSMGLKGLGTISDLWHALTIPLTLSTGSEAYDPGIGMKIEDAFVNLVGATPSTLNLPYPIPAIPTSPQTYDQLTVASAWTPEMAYQGLVESTKKYQASIAAGNPPQASDSSTNWLLIGIAGVGIYAAYKVIKGGR